MQPSITIVTSTFNCAEDLELTAQSVRNQKYENIQWIVADGESTDGTADVINSNLDVVTNWFSEKDRGIYDAWNKASRFIVNDWVIFLGAGDVFDSSTSLAKFWDAIQVIGFNTKIVNLNQTDLPSIARGQLVRLKSNAKAAAARATDRLSKLHLLDLVARIDKALDPK